MIEHASGMVEQPSFRELLDETRTRSNGILSSSYPNSQALLTVNVVKDVPEAVKLQILSSIRSFVEKQIE